jgi:hypothetical protein
MILLAGARFCTPAGDSSSSSRFLVENGDHSVTEQTEGNQLIPQVTTTNNPTTGTLTFGVTFASTDYTINVYYPEPTTEQYGFTITRQVTDSTGKTSTVVVIELAYKDDTQWKIVAGLPASLQVDSNLTVNQLSIDLVKGAAVDFPKPSS